MSLSLFHDKTNFSFACDSSGPSVLLTAFCYWLLTNVWFLLPANFWQQLCLNIDEAFL